MPKRQIYATDVIIEVAIPILIIGLIWSLVVFAITIKGVFYPGQEFVLKFVFFLYVMGAVMINRLAGYYGESNKAMAYSILLVGVMALFALTFSGRYGYMVGGENVGEGILANLAIVAVVGFAAYKVSRESCLDLNDPEEKEKSVIQLRSEMKDQRDWYRREMLEEEEERTRQQGQRKEAAQKENPEPVKLSRKHAGAWIIYFSLFSMIVFAVGQRLLPEDDYSVYRYTFTCLAANLLCALSLLLLISLSALRKQCWEKKTLVPPGVGWFWILAGSALIVFVVSMATLPPRPVPEYLVRSAAPTVLPAIPEEQEEEESSSSPRTWAGLNKEADREAVREELERREMQRQAEDTDEESDGAGDESESEGTGWGSGGQQAGKASEGESAAGKEGSGKDSRRESQGQSTTVYSGKAQRAPLPTPPLAGLQTLGKALLYIILVIGALWALAMLLLAIGKTNPLAKLASRLKSLRDRMRNLLKGAKRPKLRGQKLQEALVQSGLYMENPFRNQGLLAQMSRAELVSYTYQAFENYSHILGHTPSAGETAIEFFRSLPDELRASEFSALVKLFMLAKYSRHEIPDQSLTHLKKAWNRIEA